MNSDTTADDPRYPRRSARARRTRMALIEAAGELFVAHGYVATTVEMIAERAGVARATVFTSVPGGKSELLRLARDIALAGDDEPVPVPQRRWFVDAMAQTDPRELLARQAANYTAMLGRAAALEQVLSTAASADERLAELHGTASAQRHHGARMVAGRLAELGALHPDVDVIAAADTIFALASADLYQLVVGDRGWTAATHERWLNRQLRLALLADP